MKRNLLVGIILVGSLWTRAQVIAEVKNISFYEHHSTDMTGESFGSGANGSKSGYDFVNRVYFNSFKAATMGPYQNGEEKDIDMVEHAGPFGTNGSSMYLGFTSGVSSIWGGDIKGNGTSKWHKVAGGVNVYDSLKNYTDLKTCYNPATAVNAIAEVKKDEVYIGKIRNTDLYVMIRCTSIKLAKGQQGIEDNSAFMFDYKFGSESGVTGMNDISQASFTVYPNPAHANLFISSEKSLAGAQLILSDITGKNIQIPSENILIKTSGIELNTLFLPSGLYTIRLQNNEHQHMYSGHFLKAD